MKRKIVKHGPSSLTITLPMSWVKEHDLKPGDELDVVIDGDQLLIGGSGKPKPKSLIIDVSGTKNMLNRIVAASYKAGYDEVTYKYKTAEELDLIQKTVDRACHTFDIVQYTQDRVVVKSISSLDPNEFDTIQKRLFFTIMDLMDELVKAMEKSDYLKLQNLMLVDRTVDKHTDFIRRIMNRGHAPDVMNAHPVYIFAEQVEIMCDYYKRLAEHIAKNQLKVSKPLIELQKKVNKLLKAMFETYMKFSLEGIKEIGRLELEVKKALPALKGNDDLQVILYINQAFEVGFELKSALMTCKLDKV